MADKKRFREGEDSESPKGETWAVCVDGGDASKRAFDWVLNHVHKSKDQIVVLYVSELVKSNLPHPSPFYQNLEKQLNDELHKHAHQILEYFDGKLKEANIAHKIEELSGTSAKDLIVEYTQRTDVDHLVLGRRSMGDQERKLLGSTTDYCVRHAHSNVLIIK